MQPIPAQHPVGSDAPPPRTQDGELLRAHGISKSFPAVRALDDVRFELRRGTVHALMGENGAGKSTLMKILAGVIQPDEGTIHLKGERVSLKTPLEALSHGIAMIHQELNLMPSMTVAENVWIRREPLGRFGLVDHARMRRMTQELFDRLNIGVDPDARIGDLSVASRQMVEIAKAISYESDVLIMDEPTSALTEKEADHLFEIIADLKKGGVGIVYISHKMDEILKVSDDISIFRDGRYIGTYRNGEISRDEIVFRMVDRELSQMFPKDNVPSAEIALSVRDLTLDGVFKDVSFDLRAGEILGFAGLVGAGRSNIAETLFGVTPATSGEIRIRDRRIDIRSPGQAIRNGVGYLTEDRGLTGSMQVLSVQENMQVAVLQNGFTRAGFLSGAGLREICSDMCGRLKVKAAGLETPIGTLSGGNQQKVLLGRWLLTRPQILILDEPTKGIDVGAKAEIHALISQMAGNGAAIILISSEMPEILGMSDRVVVVHEGRIAGILDRKDATQVSIMEMIAR